jgi:hypothetical protein
MNKTRCATHSTDRCIIHFFVVVAVFVINDLTNSILSVLIYCELEPKGENNHIIIIS